MDFDNRYVFISPVSENYAEPCKTGEIPLKFRALTTPIASHEHDLMLTLFCCVKSNMHKSPVVFPPEYLKSFTTNKITYFPLSITLYLKSYFGFETFIYLWISHMVV